MTNLLPLLLIMPVSVLVAEDFRNREVHLSWLLVFAAGVVAVAFFTAGFRESLTNMLYNIALLAYMALGVVAWLWIKYRKEKGRLKDYLKCYLGAGDVVFILALTPLFELRGYLIFLLAAMTGSLVWWAAVRLVRRKSISIPFVGTAGIMFCAYLIIRIL